VNRCRPQFSFHCPLYKPLVKAQNFSGY